MLDLIIKYGKIPFGYNSSKGELDCAHFVYNIIRDFKGIDYGDKFEKNKYSTEKEAYKLIMSLGYNNIVDLVTGELNLKKGASLMAQTGDIVASLNDDKSFMLGVCYEEYAFFKGKGQKIFKKHLIDCACSWETK
jgi:hypothetical protein